MHLPIYAPSLDTWQLGPKLALAAHAPSFELLS